MPFIPSAHRYTHNYYYACIMYVHVVVTIPSMYAAYVHGAYICNTSSMQLYLDSNLEPWFLVQWTEDNSLTVISENAIKAGNKTIGSNVEAMFKKKSYEATVLKIGEFLVLKLLNLYRLSIK